MPRIRTIKPEHWNDKELTKITLPAHLLWIALWNFADDEGVFENDVNLIKSQVFPRRADIRLEQITEWLGQLAKARYIVPFEYKNESYYIHRTFKTHQRIDKPNPSKIPSDIIRGLIQEQYKNDTRLVAPESIVKDSKGRESNAREILQSDQPPETTITNPLQLSKLLLADEIFVGDMSLTHRGKDLQQAILECWGHRSEKQRTKMMIDDWKRLVNTWLSNSKINRQQNNVQKPKSTLHPTLLNQLNEAQ